MKDIVMRSLPFNKALYEKLMDDAKEEDRPFPRHIMWILKQYLGEKDDGE